MPDSSATSTTTVDTIRKVVVIDTIKGTVDVSTPGGIYSTQINDLEYWLQLNEDKSYRLEEKDKKGSSRSTLSGNWGMDENDILLYDNRTVIGKLSRSGDSIYVSELKNAKTAGKDQLLKRYDLASSDTQWTNRKSKGVDFYGLGNEPFWNIEIDNENLTSFKMADWKQSVSLKTVKPTMTKDSIYYNFTGANKISVTVYNQFCSDGMSDKMYSNKVKIRYKGQTYSGCGEYFNSPKK